MELRHLQYFVRVVELGSLEQAAREMGLAPSVLDEGMARLESIVAAPLLRHTNDGVLPTEAGVSFFRESQLALRHADRAAHAGDQSGLSGNVSIGLTPTACSVLGMPLILEARKRYPDVRLHMVESLSGHLATMLNARQIDLAVLYGTHPAHRWNMNPLMEERMFLIQSARNRARSLGPKVSLSDLKQVPLILPTGTHSLRNVLDAAFRRARVQPVIAVEIDSLAMLMHAVDTGLGATIQPWAATSRYSDAAERFELAEISDPEAVRFGSLCSLSNDEMSPAALATRVLLAVCARDLVRSGVWVGARISDHR